MPNRPASVRSEGRAIFFSVPGVPVIRERTAFRPGYSEICTANAVFALLLCIGTLREAGEGTEFWKDSEPKDSTKHRDSAFCGTELDRTLHAAGQQRAVSLGTGGRGSRLSGSGRLPSFYPSSPQCGEERPRRPCQRP